jgi:TRAP-type C4-dicarboxylate transport system substrate-binding protein
MSLNFWKKLSKEYQNAILEASKETSLYERKLWNSEENDTMEKLKAAGVQINEVPNIEPFREKAKPIWEKYKGKLPKGLIEQIQAVK